MTPPPGLSKIFLASCDPACDLLTPKIDVIRSCPIDHLYLLASKLVNAFLRYHVQLFCSRQTDGHMDTWTDKWRDRSRTRCLHLKVWPGRGIKIEHKILLLMLYRITCSLVTTGLSGLLSDCSTAMRYFLNAASFFWCICFCNVCISLLWQCCISVISARACSSSCW